MSLRSEILVLDLSSGSNLPPLPASPDLQSQINGLYQSKNALLDEAWTYPAKSENHLSLRHQAKLVGTKIWRLEKLQRETTYNATAASLHTLVAFKDDEIDLDNQSSLSLLSLEGEADSQDGAKLEQSQEPKLLESSNEWARSIEESNAVKRGQEGPSSPSRPDPDKAQLRRELRPRKAKTSTVPVRRPKASARYRTPPPPPPFEPTEAFLQSDLPWGDVYGIDNKLIGPAYVPNNGDNPGYVLVRPVRLFTPPTKEELSRRPV